MVDAQGTHEMDTSGDVAQTSDRSTWAIKVSCRTFFKWNTKEKGLVSPLSGKNLQFQHQVL